MFRSKNLSFLFIISIIEDAHASATLLAIRLNISQTFLDLGQ